MRGWETPTVAIFVGIQAMRDRQVTAQHFPSPATFETNDVIPPD
jgi:hypothetical protein